MLMDVLETGNYQTDYEAGQAVAARYVELLKECDVSPFHLADMVELFSERFGAIERGFLAGISLALIKI